MFEVFCLVVVSTFLKIGLELEIPAPQQQQQQ